MRLAEEAAEARAREALEQQMKAQRAEELAKTDQEIADAQAEAARVQALVDEAEAERKRVQEDKRQLAIDVETEKQKAKLAAEELEKAKADLAAQEALLKKKEALAKETKVKMEAQIAEAQKRAADKRASVNNQMIEEQKAADKAKAEREAAHKASEAAKEKAHQEELAARRERDAVMKAEHEKKLQARKAAYEKMFRNVWNVGPAGLSQASFTVDSTATAEAVISALFKDTMISEVTQFKDSTTRTFKNGTELNQVRGKMHEIDHEVYLDMVTSDDRVAEMIETAIKVSGDPNLDILVTPLSGVSPDFSEWAKKQTIEADPSDSLYNDDPFKGSTPIAEEAIAKMQDFQHRLNLVQE